MKNPVIALLEENLSHIKLVQTPTKKPFTIDRDNTGNKREITIQEFILAYLTPDYQARKGHIFSMDSSSQSIDCVVLFSNHPRLITPARDMIIAEGVFAAVEIKPNISTLTAKSEFHRGLLQIQSVKKLERKIERFPILPGQKEPPAYFDKIPGVIFSFNSQSLDNIIAYIRKVVTDSSFSSNDLPDIIISIDKGILFYSPHIGETIFKKSLNEMFESYPDEMIVKIAEVGSTQLRWFLALFLNLPRPSFAFSKSILLEYLNLYFTNTISYHPLLKGGSFKIKQEETT